MNPRYTLRKSRRARRLSVAVHCDASVIVTAPVYLGDHVIERFLRDNARWILEKVGYFKKIGIRPRVVLGRREYKKHKEAARTFVAQKVEEINRVYNFRFGRIAIKNQKRRWGSCSREGNLNFNYKIILLPEHLAEYIIAHELCHLKEFNHSRNFWTLLSRAIPDCYACRRELRKQVF